jgi:hypothetical protein
MIERDYQRMKRIVARCVLLCCMGLCQACSSSEKRLANDAFGPLSGQDEQAYLQEMEKADAFVPQLDH